MAENPWTNLAAEVSEIKTPKAVFKEQAELLASATGRKVYGEVKTGRSSDGNVILDLNAVVPSLSGYRVTLARATHDPRLYPCDVRSDWLRENLAATTAENAEQLAQRLVAILKTPELQKLVAAVYAQASG